MVVNVGEIAEQAIRPPGLGAQEASIARVTAQEASIARVNAQLVETCLQPPLAGLRDRREHGL
jgi:hypothetical protein